MLTIGLFGTCGESKWRNPFIKEYEKRGISYFNPQVDDWNESLAEIEAKHLAEDKVILFPVTSETYGMGSLSEVGFSILNAIKLDDRRDFVILIDNQLNDNLEDAKLRKESLRSRALVMAHLKKLRLDNVYLVETLEEMMDVSLSLYESQKLRSSLEKFNPHKRI